MFNLMITIIYIVKLVDSFSSIHTHPFLFFFLGMWATLYSHVGIVVDILRLCCTYVYILLRVPNKQGKHFRSVVYIWLFALFYLPSIFCGLYYDLIFGLINPCGALLLRCIHSKMMHKQNMGCINPIHRTVVVCIGCCNQMTTASVTVLECRVEVLGVSKNARP